MSAASDYLQSRVAMKPSVVATEAIDASRKSQGVVRFDAVQRRERFHHFTIVEAWQDAASHDMNLGAPHAKKFREDMQP